MLNYLAWVGLVFLTLFLALLFFFIVYMIWETAQEQNKKHYPRQTPEFDLWLADWFRTNAGEARILQPGPLALKLSEDLQRSNFQVFWQTDLPLEKPNA